MLTSFVVGLGLGAHINRHFCGDLRVKVDGGRILCHCEMVPVCAVLKSTGDRPKTATSKSPVTVYDGGILPVHV